VTPTPADRRGGLRLAFTLLTIVPLPARSTAPTVDRASAAVAMRAATLVGLVLGAVVGTLGRALVEVGAPSLVAGALTIGAGVLLTRGLHLDGLADTVDGLGSHRPADGALEVMRKPDVGPFGVAALALTLLTQAAAASAALGRPWLAAVVTVAVATATGRLAITLACRRGVRAARPDGLGAMVAGTVGPAAIVVATIAVAGIATFAVPGRPWQGPVSVVMATAVAALFTGHCVRRFGGVTGDVLGAACELAATAAYVLLTVAG
jgi:adenosylcobinamide-GDP ribazoletransferase